MKTNYIHIYLKRPYNRKWGVLKELIVLNKQDLSLFWRDKIDLFLEEFRVKNPELFKQAVQIEHNKARAEADKEFEQDFGYAPPPVPEGILQSKDYLVSKWKDINTSPSK